MYQISKFLLIKQVVFDIDKIEVSYIFRVKDKFKYFRKKKCVYKIKEKLVLLYQFINFSVLKRFLYIEGIEFIFSCLLVFYFFVALL